MYNEDTDVLFPPRAIPQLQDLRDDLWRDLVSNISKEPPASVERVAFVLLMVRLAGCNTCHADSFRAMRGCTQCAIQTVRRHRGSDQTLFEAYEEARQEVERYLNKIHR